MDLRYWRCPEGHVSVADFSLTNTYCSKCNRDYKVYEGGETADPNPPNEEDTDGISSKPYPYD